MKGTPKSIMMRLAVMAGTKFGNRPYSNATLRFLYGPQGIAPERQDLDGHNACHRCVSETTVKDCRTCVYRDK